MQWVRTPRKTFRVHPYARALKISEGKRMDEALSAVRVAIARSIQ